MLYSFSELTVHPVCFSPASWEKMLTLIGGLVSQDFCRAPTVRVRIWELNLFDNYINMKLDVRSQDVAEALTRILDQQERDERVIEGTNEITLSLFHTLAILRTAVDICENLDWLQAIADNILHVKSNLLRFSKWGARLFGLRRKVTPSVLGYSYTDYGELLTVTLGKSTGLKLPRYQKDHRLSLCSQRNQLTFRTPVTRGGLWNWAFNRLLDPPGLY